MNEDIISTYMYMLTNRALVIRTSIIRTFQLTEHPKSNSSMCIYEKLFGHGP